jgi:hypothetical protein
MSASLSTRLLIDERRMLFMKQMLDEKCVQVRQRHSMVDEPQNRYWNDGRSEQ